MKKNMLFALMNAVKNIFPVSQKLSLCNNKISRVFPVWKKNQIPCFPCTVATLYPSLPCPGQDRVSLPRKSQDGCAFTQENFLVLLYHFNSILETLDKKKKFELSSLSVSLVKFLHPATADCGISSLSVAL